MGCARPGEKGKGSIEVKGQGGSICVWRGIVYIFLFRMQMSYDSMATVPQGFPVCVCVLKIQAIPGQGWHVRSSAGDKRDQREREDVQTWYLYVSWVIWSLSAGEVAPKMHWGRFWDLITQTTFRGDLGCMWPPSFFVCALLTFPGQQQNPLCQMI